MTDRSVDLTDVAAADGPHDVTDDLDSDVDRTDAWLVDASRRLEPPGGDVDRLISSITRGVQRVRRPGRSLATDDAGIAMSDRVVKQLLATRVRAELGRLVVFAAVDGAGDEATGIRLGLVARYHDDLLDDANQVRDVVSRVLIDALGAESSAAARRDIAVRWQDIYTREWFT